jgi:hypothetical protein
MPYFAMKDARINCTKNDTKKGQALFYIANSACAQNIFVPFNLCRLLVTGLADYSGLEHYPLASNNEQ